MITRVCLISSTAIKLINKQIHLVGERFILKIHQNTTNYSYIVDVSVSIIDFHQRKLPLMKSLTETETSTM